MEPFKAKRADGRPEWRVVYDHVVDHTAPGDTVPYAVLGSLLVAETRPQIYRAVAQANKKLRDKAQRSLQVVREVGYRVLKPEEHEHQASDYQMQARRRVSTAVSVMRATDLKSMTPEARNWALQVTAGLVLMGRAIDDHAGRLAQHEDLIKQLQARIETLEGGES